MTTPPPPPPTTNRWQLLRDVLVFQAKLLVDGLRDLLMSPASLISVLVGLLTERHEPDRHFRRLIRLGARSERWINLFGQQDQRPGEGTGKDLDEVFGLLENRLREQYERGGLTAQAKHVIDRALDSVADRVATEVERARVQPGETDPGDPPTAERLPKLGED